MQPAPLYRAPAEDELSVLRRGQLPDPIRRSMQELAAVFGAPVSAALHRGAERGVAVRREGVLERRRVGFGKSTHWAWFLAGQQTPLHVLRTPWPGPGAYYTTEDPAILVASDLPTAAQLAAARSWFLAGQSLDEDGVRQLERGLTPPGLRATAHAAVPPVLLVAATGLSACVLASQLAGPPWNRAGMLLALLGFLGGLAYLFARSTRTTPGGARVVAIRGPAEVVVSHTSHRIRIGECEGTFSYDAVGSLLVHGASYRGFVLEGTRTLVALLP